MKVSRSAIISAVSLAIGGSGYLAYGAKAIQARQLTENLLLCEVPKGFKTIPDLVRRYGQFAFVGAHTIYFADHGKIEPKADGIWNTIVGPEVWVGGDTLKADGSIECTQYKSFSSLIDLKTGLMARNSVDAPIAMSLMFSRYAYTGELRDRAWDPCGIIEFSLDDKPRMKRLAGKPSHGSDCFWKLVKGDIGDIYQRPVTITTGPHTGRQFVFDLPEEEGYVGEIFGVTFDQGLLIETSDKQGYDRWLRVAHLKEGVLEVSPRLTKLTRNSMGQRVSISLDGKKVAIFDENGYGRNSDGDIRLFNLPTGNERFVARGLHQRMLRMRISPDNQYLAVTTDGGFFWKEL